LSSAWRVTASPSVAIARDGDQRERGHDAGRDFAARLRTAVQRQR
jgi:hypothetical protein